MKLKTEIKFPNNYTFKVKKITHNTDISFTDVYSVKITDLNNIIDNLTFVVQDTVSGCGLSIIRGVLLPSDEKAIAFGEALKQFFSCKIVGNLIRGTVLCTLGESYIKFYHERVLKMGFKEIHEFPNPIHSGSKQKIYALTIDNL